MSYSFPKAMKKLRACMRCHLVKTEDQFQQEGCDNCRGNKNEIMSNITQHFKGVIAITNPRHSWCAKWMNKHELLPGFYCLDIINNEEEEEHSEYEDDEMDGQVIDDEDGDFQ